MVSRRALAEGLNADEGIDLEAAEQFITGGNPPRPAKASPPAPKAPKPPGDEFPAPAPLPRSLTTASAPAPSPLTGVGRVPVGARVRTEIASSLKRASLERQLHGIQPNSVQEILEDALELWLHKHGY